MPGGITRKGGLQSRGKSETAPVDGVGKRTGSRAVLALCLEGHAKLLAFILVSFKGKGFQILKSFSIMIGILNNPVELRR
jgi:hypothetical protein